MDANSLNNDKLFTDNHQDEIPVRDTSYVRTLNEKALELLEQGRLDSAAVLLDEVLNLAEILDDLEGESFATANLGKYYDMRGMPDSTVTVLRENMEKYRETEKYTRIGNLLATAYHQLGNFQESLDLYRDMLDIAVQEQDTSMQIALTQNMGNSYGSLGDIPSAIDSYLSGMEMAEAQQDTLALAVVLDNLASINSEEGNFELAEKYLFRALDLNREIENWQNQITNHMSLGILYKDWEKYEQAREHYERVLEIADDTGNVISRIQAIYNLGVLYTDMGETDTALESFRESLRLSEENNIPIGFFYNRAGIGDLYTEIGEYEQAIENYQEALEIAEMVQGSELIRNTLLNLYEAAEAAGDTLVAYPYLERYTAMLDSLSQTEREAALARQEAMLELRSEREQRSLLEDAIETQRRNTIIVWALLAIILIVLAAVIILYRKSQRANNLLQKRTEELSEVNEVKDKLLSVLAHDLRTPISNIQGVVYLIRENLLDEEDLDNALTHIDFQLQQGINTLTNYLEWAQEHRGGITADMENFKLLDIVESSLHEIQKSAENKGVDLINEVDEEIAVWADKHMMNVILRNLLSNAIKYVDEGDTVTVGTRETVAGVEMYIQDTGQGIPKEKLNNLFKPFNRVTRGTKGEIGTGLGLALCKEFSEKQGGSIQCDSKVGHGTTFTLILQKADDIENREPIAENEVKNS
ncbi:MAG: tetratricopeptide repeat-containing sensor histidine kinase [Balneolaceae bacterium]|nr:tetratricopeptide repeat-containing sensor histidine kinase [Balneolaceae bacterium]